MGFDPGGYGLHRTEVWPRCSRPVQPAGQDARGWFLPRLETAGDAALPGAGPTGRAPRGSIILPDGVIERLQLSVAPDPAASATARAALAAWADGQLPPPVIADLLLVASELVTNSLRHAGLGADDAVLVLASVNHSSLRLEVENPGVSGDVAVRAPDADGGGGFGLQLVAALAERWGVVRDDSTRVWAEIGSQPRV
jgi:anti-sigma regulatory factor (Ser/Thr protein kinase)